MLGGILVIVADVWNKSTKKVSVLYIYTFNSHLFHQAKIEPPVNEEQEEEEEAAKSEEPNGDGDKPVTARRRVRKE